MKILIINPSANLGGGNTISNNLAEGLDKNYFDVFCFFPSKGPASETLNNKIKIFYSSKTSFFSIIKNLRKIIKQNQIDIVHAQGTRAACWTRILFLFSKNRPKIIYTLHGFHIIRKNFVVKNILLFFERILNRCVDVLVCVGESDKNLVLKYKTILSNKIKVIKNGIDLLKFQINPESAENIKHELNLNNKLILSSIARLHPQKDILTILNSIKIISSKIDNFILLIIGDGPLRLSLERQVKNLNITDKVIFLGARKDVPILINISDIIILSTNWEGLPLIPLEAGASKKPIVASNVDGVRETIIDGKTGFLFKQGSAEDLSDKLLKLVQSEELRKEMGENGFKYVSENFSKEKMIKEYQNLYMDLYYENSSGK
ncbi:MAG TPA: glycosyltransferase family 4 protein [Candidatus Pacearchaeota archaeon]|nr:glycosyltransferase family 4 protein [Candidatus Pacearchaeota archaeon]